MRFVREHRTGSGWEPDLSVSEVKLELGLSWEEGQGEEEQEERGERGQVEPEGERRGQRLVDSNSCGWRCNPCLPAQGLLHSKPARQQWQQGLLAPHSGRYV